MTSTNSRKKESVCINRTTFQDGSSVLQPSAQLLTLTDTDTITQQELVSQIRSPVFIRKLS